VLREFIHTHRRDLIERCSFKVSQRSSPSTSATELQFGVPLILEQLCQALLDEQSSPTSQEGSVFGDAPNTAGWIEAGRTAALHGIELFNLGYSLDQVVHDYGDLCQAVTELASEVAAPITLDEFHTFNRLLDYSIASAVSAFGRLQHSGTAGEGAQALHDRLGTLAEEQRRLLDTALSALDALKVGNIGLMGATGTVLEDTLLKLRNLVDRSLPELRTESGMITVHPDEQSAIPDVSPTAAQHLQVAR
jgi:hypothetical protein